MSDLKTRRFFLGALTAASTVRVWGANDKVTVGIVSLGGRGTTHLPENFSGTKKVDQLTPEAGAPKSGAATRATLRKTCGVSRQRQWSKRAIC